jgi:hypothetical protein
MRKRNSLRLFFVTSFALAIMVSGCDDDLTALEGVYEIQTWTENTTGCDSDGDSILEERSDDHFYLKAENLFGQEFLNLVLCEGLDTCLTTAAEDTINLGFGLDSGSDGAGWTGSGYTLGGSDTCSGEVRNNSLVESEAGQLRFEIRRTFVEDVPLDSDGFCDSDAAIAAAESQGCEGLEVTTAMQVSDL